MPETNELRLDKRVMDIMTARIEKIPSVRGQQEVLAGFIEITRVLELLSKHNDLLVATIKNRDEMIKLYEQNEAARETTIEYLMTLLKLHGIEVKPDDDHAVH
jgi:hypothetical protein